MPPLQEVRPILHISPRSRIRIISQAPGTRAHAIGRSFDDPSGVRLRSWLGVDEASFWNPNHFAITPMGFCFPGQNVRGGDLPPRRECAPLWQAALDAELGQSVELTLLIGMYAQRHVLGPRAKRTLTETVRCWRDYGPEIIPLPHPSWRNNAWLKTHDWFPPVLEHVKARIRDIIFTTR